MNLVALITGAGRREGLGFETAKQLAQKGCHVILSAASRRENDLAILVEELKSGGLDASFVIMDITDEESVRNAAELVGKRHGKLDILINNAAIMRIGETVANQNIPEVRQILDTNVVGTWNVTQKFLPLIRNSAHGRIVNVSSGAGSLGDEQYGFFNTNADIPAAVAYSVSKLALNGLTIQMAKEFAKYNISVNAVCPSVTKTYESVGNFGRPVSESAKSVVWAAILPDGEFTGKFFRDGKQIPW